MVIPFASNAILDPSTTFLDLAITVDLDIRLRKAISKLSYTHPTLVQAKCIPLSILQGRDILVHAKTGCGKTLAYALPIVHKILCEKKIATIGNHYDRDELNRNNNVKAIVLLPTRELCNQVAKVLQDLTYYCDDLVAIVALLGFSGKVNNRGDHCYRDIIFQEEVMLRDRPDIIVGTPSGLLHHIKQNEDFQKKMKDSVNSFVIDEADLLLSFGYADDVSEIISFLPKIYQGYILSATLNSDIESLRKGILHSPVVLKIEDDSSSINTNEGQLYQFYIKCSQQDKYLILYVFLKLGLLRGKGLLFVNSINVAYRLKLTLEQFHIRSAVLNAQLPLISRFHIVEHFNVGSFEYLIATDEIVDVDDNNDKEKEEYILKAKEKDKKTRILQNHKNDFYYGAARGLDFRDVSFVINFDFPVSVTSYIHRIGRTARSSAHGVALSFIVDDAFDQLEMLKNVQNYQPPLPSKVGGILDRTLPLVVMSRGDSEDEGQQKKTYVEEQLRPSPLVYDSNMIEGFRYRVEDVIRAVTKTSIRETRAAELRAEILNSQRLHSHFEKSTADMQLLRHDRPGANKSRRHDHLKHIPEYLIPRGMRVANLTKRKRRHRFNKKKVGNHGTRNKGNDPLQTFVGVSTLDYVDEGTDNKQDQTTSK